MNVLILGSGGREHALAWKIHQSPLVDRVFVAPGNGGTAQVATNLPIDPNDFPEVKQAVLAHEINLVVVGPEEPLVRGVVDFLKQDDELKGIKIVGPSAEAARLEGSKDFAKQFMLRHGIPTGGARLITKENLADGLAYLGTAPGPYVLKADGLAAGKGVIITKDLKDARHQLEDLLGGRFGKASESVLIEEFLDGIELSVFVITDGKSYLILPEAKDYKRIGEGDTGPNTGGMGAISPVPFADDEFMKKVEERIVKPTVDGISKEGLDYCGFIFFGLIKVGNDPFVIEYNVRMGDPETEVVMPRVKSDIVPALIAAARGTLDQVPQLAKDERIASTVVAVSGGYPGSYEKGLEISLNHDNADAALCFHAGTKKTGTSLVTNGGRVLALTGLGGTLEEALSKSYGQLKNIMWKNITYRKDIGFDL